MTSTPKPLLRSEIPGLRLLSRGKVRDVYDLGERLLIVATDRISAFDCVLPTPIPGKGALLNSLSAFWFRKTADAVPNHLITTDMAEIQRALPPEARLDPELYDGRVLLARKARRVDAECIVRGYLAGSGWKEYREKGALCSEKLAPGLLEASPLPRPVFTPSTKASSGHDENISRERLAELTGTDTARELERLSLELYGLASRHAQERGLILADTKFEFGFIDGRPHDLGGGTSSGYPSVGRLCAIDEMLTPDSSRFWDKDAYRPGVPPPNFDKQFVRDWLERSAWDKRPPAPELPPEVVDGTARRYQEAFRRLTQ